MRPILLLSALALAASGAAAQTAPDDQAQRKVVGAATSSTYWDGANLTAQMSDKRDAKPAAKPPLNLGGLVGSMPTDDRFPHFDMAPEAARNEAKPGDAEKSTEKRDQAPTSRRAP